MTLIQDGGGSGKRVRVNSENMMLTSAVISTLKHHTNHHDGEAYNLLFEQAPTANDDCILYMENTNQKKDIVAESITIAVDAACEVYAQLRANGTRNSATSLIPVNLNSGFNLEAQGKFEKGPDLDGNAGVGTLDGNKVEVFRYKFITSSGSQFINFDQDLILSPNTTLTIWCDTAGVTVQGMIPFNYHNPDLD